MRFILSLIIAFFISSTFSAVTVNEIAPNFSLQNTFGETVNLASLRGSMVVLEWTNHDCPFVAKHYKTGNMQETQKVAKEYKAIWLSIISSAPKTQGYVSNEEANNLTGKRNAHPSHVLTDSGGSVGKKYGAKTTPHMFIIDSSGILKYQGAIDDAGGRGFMFKDLKAAKNYIKLGLQELHENKEISTSISRPYGCSVKYKN